MTESQLAQTEDEAIRQVIDDQEHHGLPVVSDAEFRRVVFMDSFAEIDGFPRPAFSEEFFNFQEDPAGGSQVDRRKRPSVAATGRLRLGRNRPLDEYRFASSIASRPVKVTIIGPERILRHLRIHAGEHHL